MKYLYKYPQAEFPYTRLVENRYFDVVVEYAKDAPEDMLVRISVTNHGPERASVDLLPTIWFRNTWSWGNSGPRPQLRRTADPKPAIDGCPVETASGPISTTRT